MGRLESFRWTQTTPVAVVVWRSGVDLAPGQQRDPGLESRDGRSRDSQLSVVSAEA